MLAQPADIEPRQLGEGQIVDERPPPRQPRAGWQPGQIGVERRVMAQHRDAVPRQRHIHLERPHAGRDGGAKPLDGVLRIQGAGTPVPDNLHGHAGS